MNVLDPAGPLASHIAALWWLFVIVCAVVYALVVAALLFAMIRRRRDVSERRTGIVVTAATVLTILLLFVLTGASYSTGRSLSGFPHGVDPVRIRVTGHQWWWELRYEAEQPVDLVVTANEMHVPVGRPVELSLVSVDVIHSFWVPNLQGKRDLIPGHTTTMVLQADRPGVYRGRCAEFCGAQHALMAMDVVAEPPDAYDAWLAAQRRPAATPETDEQRRGRDVFLGSRCPMCHRVVGTTAAALVAPDLTHVASRRTIAAGTLPNTRGHRAGWIADPQGLKPGVRMPSTPMDPADFQALLAYMDLLR
jgi:cytochrome c oxidase subunit 2